MFAYLLSVVLFAQATADAPAQTPAATPAATATAPAQPAETAAKPAEGATNESGAKAVQGTETESGNTGDGSGSATPATPAAPPFDFGRFALMLFVTGILFYFIMLRPQRKKEQDLRDRIGNVKENERVVTIGGIHGVVTNVRRDQQRITIRVDEATGTKLQLNISAIARVVTGDDDEKAADGKKS